MKVDITGTGIELESEKDTLQTARLWHSRLCSGSEKMSGWVSLPIHFNETLLQKIQETAEEIRRKCDLLIVVGVGGSYLGAKAIIDALNGSRDSYPEILFAGFNMNAAYLDKVVRRLRHESVCLCAISKSGSTLEPLLTYSILREKMYEKYGEERANQRIYIITDEQNGMLRQDVLKKEYTSFAVPEDIGGRYSVLTVVGLLPIAVAGYDIQKLLSGAKEIALSDDWRNSLLDYTVCRVALQKQGKTMEIFEYFESNLRYFGEWLKQLFGESEGKCGKGAFPASLCFSTDLHSIGQFLQEGTQMFFETLIQVKNSNHDFVIPEHAGFPYAGKTLEQINECSELGVVAAHKTDGIPVTVIEIPTLDEWNLGQLIYFFEMSCALSAYNLGVNPFNQPGVEKYKRETKHLIEMM